MSFNGLREIFSYSVSSLFCFIFLKVRCEAGKIVLGTQLGASPVAYLGTPDNVANRLHVLVSSGAETLLPRFSAERQSSVAQRLFLNATWASLVSSLVLLLPLVLLFPDFLRLWIGAEFARESALVGQLVAISYIFHGAYAPAGAYFRGIGRPWLVTLVVGLAAGTILLGSVLLIPSHGVAGVGYAYALGSVPALIGLVHCWFYLFGREWGGLLRSVGLPLVLAGAVMLLERTVLTWLLPLTWVSLAGLGMAFVALMSLALFGADWLLGGENPPSRQFLGNVLRSRRVMSLKRRLPFGRRGRVAS
jgi:O-antigen/teichoic acid export membrane protein